MLAPSVTHIENPLLCSAYQVTDKSANKQKYSSITTTISLLQMISLNIILFDSLIKFIQESCETLRYLGLMIPLSKLIELVWSKTYCKYGSQKQYIFTFALYIYVDAMQ